MINQPPLGHRGLHIGALSHPRHDIAAMMVLQHPRYEHVMGRACQCALEESSDCFLNNALKAAGRIKSVIKQFGGH